MNPLPPRSFFFDWSRDLTDDATPEVGPDDRVHIALCADHGFVMPLAVALASLAASFDTKRIRVHVVHSGFDGDLRRRLLVGAVGLKVEWYEFDPTAIVGVSNTECLTAAALYRLSLGAILPSDVKKVLYLDADVLVASDVKELFARDLGGRCIGAVRDAGSPWAAGVCGPDWQRLEMNPGSPYFNSGVLLIDLEAWRRTGAGDGCLDVLRHVDTRWGDQDALNKVFEGNWTELPRRWNVQTADMLRNSFSWALSHEEIEKAVADPGVIHFTSREKPWLPGADHPAAGLWFDVLDKTEWKGWRPARSIYEHRGLVGHGASAVRAARRWREQRRNRLPQ